MNIIQSLKVVFFGLLAIANLIVFSQNVFGDTGAPFCVIDQIRTVLVHPVLKRT